MGAPWLHICNKDDYLCLSKQLLEQKQEQNHNSNSVALVMEPCHQFCFETVLSNFSVDKMNGRKEKEGNNRGSYSLSLEWVPNCSSVPLAKGLYTHHFMVNDSWNKTCRHSFCSLSHLFIHAVDKDLSLTNARQWIQQARDYRAEENYMVIAKMEVKASGNDTEQVRA